MDEIEAYAKTLVSRTQLKADMLREASPSAATRKRNSDVLHESNDTKTESIPEEESLKRVCGGRLATLIGTQGKENHPSMQMDVDGTNGHAAPSKEHVVNDVKPTKKNAMQECRASLARGNMTPESMSVAARKALFEEAVAKSSGTLPLPRKAPPRPVLKQVFSTVKIPSANLTLPLTTAVSLRIDATGVHSSKTSRDDDTPPKKTTKDVEAVPRPPTPRRVVRTELVIKRVGSDSDCGPTTPPSAKLEERVKNSPLHTPTHHVSAAEGDPRIQDTAGVSNEDTTQSNVPVSGSDDDTEHEQQTDQQDSKGILKLSCTSVSEASVTPSGAQSPCTASNSCACTEDFGNSEDHAAKEQAQEEPIAVNNNYAEEDDGVFYENNEGPSEGNATERNNEGPHSSATVGDCDMENEEQHGCTSENGRRLISAEEAQVFDEMDEILNDALGSECSDISSCADRISNKSPAPSPVKCQEVVQENSATSFPSPEKAAGSSKSKNLPHTISFYRRQQQSLTPRRPEFEGCVSPEITTPIQSSDVPLSDRLRALQHEVTTQQNIISQASQALNLCQASSKFLGSSEQVEGERVLLIASQRRLACINEMQRLKQFGDVTVGNQLRGSFKIDKIELRLKPAFVESACGNKQGDTVYHFLCLVQHGFQVIATPMLSTDDVTNGVSLVYDKEVVFSEITEDFEVVVEVYALKSKKEAVPHDKKYHIKKDTLKLKLSTKSRKSDPKLFLSPAVSSPGGPDAVRSSNFQLMGSVVLNSDICGEKALVLSKVPMSSPLEEKIILKTQLHADHNIEHRGFLTLFQDIGGFGAWTRLWCCLRGSNIVFWRYPDEEQDKVPMDSINLRECISKDVHILSRVDCARPNSFKLILVRPLEGNEVDTITVKKHSTVASITHLFSADTREEAKAWCKKLDSVLSCIRKWDIESFQGLDLTQLV